MMASLGSHWTPLYVLLFLSAITETISKTPSSDDLSHVSQSQKGSCHNMYNYNNFYAGPNKKVEALLHEVKEELGEIREEIKSLKENKTIGQGM